MQLRINEITQDKHLKMSFIEFLEALARAADYLSLEPPSESLLNAYKSGNDEISEAVKEDEGEGEDDFTLTEEELINQPLNK